jgi:hypothetical protein
VATDDLCHSSHRSGGTRDYHFPGNDLQNQTHPARPAGFNANIRRAIQRITICTNPRHGTAEIIEQPAAMDSLIWYKRVRGEHKNWDEYLDTMQKEGRVIIRINIEKVGPQHARQR